MEQNSLNSGPSIDSLNIGDRVRLSGGYDMEPCWLAGKTAHDGRVVAYIPGQNEMLAAVIQLDEIISVDGVNGTIMVLELRYAGTQWGKHNTVHLELCDFEPEARRWQDRRRGLWIESHATCQKLGVGITSVDDERRGP